MNIFQTATTITSDWASNWIYIPYTAKDGHGTKEHFVIQGYTQGGDATNATVDLYFTLDTTLASSPGMEDVFSGTAVTINNTTAKSFAFSVDNDGFFACRLKLTMNSLTTLPTIVIGRSWE